MKLSSLTGKALMRQVRHKFAILWHTGIPIEAKLQILKTGAPRICTFMSHRLHMLLEHAGEYMGWKSTNSNLVV